MVVIIWLFCRDRETLNILRFYLYFSTHWPIFSVKSLRFTYLSLILQMLWPEKQEYRFVSKSKYAGRDYTSNVVEKSLLRENQMSKHFLQSGRLHCTRNSKIFDRESTWRHGFRACIANRANVRTYVLGKATLDSLVRHFRFAWTEPVARDSPREIHPVVS